MPEAFEKARQFSNDLTGGERRSIRVFESCRDLWQSTATSPHLATNSAMESDGLAAFAPANGKHQRVRLPPSM